MAKRFTSLLVLFFFSLYVLSSPLIWATYYTYQEYFAESFCVNKQNPDCCGKCYINEVEDEKPANDLPKIEVRTPELTSFTTDTLLFHHSDCQTLLTYGTAPNGEVSSGYPAKILQPPEPTYPI